MNKRLHLTLAKSWAFVRRDFLFETSYKLQSLYHVGGIIFTILTFYYLSRFVGNDAARTHLAPYGGDYFSFVIIGIAFLGFLNVGISTYTATIRQFMTAGVLEPMAVSRSRPITLMINNLIWPFGFELTKAALYMTLACGLLGARVSIHGLPAALLILALAMTTFSALALISGSLLIVVKRGDPLTWFFSSMSVLLGGAMFPVTLLPPSLRWLSKLLPTTYTLDGLRLALLAGRSIPELLPQIGALVLFAAVSVPLALGTVNRLFEIAKRRGGLGSY